MFYPSLVKKRKIKYLPYLKFDIKVNYKILKVTCVSCGKMIIEDLSKTFSNLYVLLVWKVVYMQAMFKDPYESIAGTLVSPLVFQTMSSLHMLGLLASADSFVSNHQ